MGKGHTTMAVAIRIGYENPNRQEARMPSANVFWFFFTKKERAFF
jgi:hypothetical protein